MPLYFGAAKLLADLNLGAVKPTACYMGATKVWPEAKPVVTLQPLAGAGYAAAVHTMTCTFTGVAPLSYQWYQYDGTTFTPIGDGTTTHAYTLIAADPLGLTFFCRCFDGYGQYTDTAHVTVTVYAAVTSTISPTSYTGTEGDSVVYTCTPGGGDGVYTYQWYRWDGATYHPYGDTTPTMTKSMLASETGQAQMCQVTSAGVAVNSAHSVMTVAPAVSMVYATGGMSQGNPATVSATVGAASPNRKIMMVTCQRGWSSSAQTVICTTTGEAGVQRGVVNRSINGSSTAGSWQLWEFPVTGTAADTALSFSISGSAEWGRIYGVFTCYSPGVYATAAYYPTQIGPSTSMTAYAMLTSAGNGHNMFAIGVSTNTGGASTHTPTVTVDPNSGGSSVANLSGSEMGIVSGMTPAMTWVAGWPFTISSPTFGGSMVVFTFGFI